MVYGIKSIKMALKLNSATKAKVKRVGVQQYFPGSP